MGRYLLGVTLVTTLTLVACGRGDAKKNAATGPADKDAHAAVTATATNASACRPVPSPAAQPVTWVPADLPLPDRTYAVSDEPTATDGTHHAVFASPITIKDFVRFAVSQWPPRGWRLGRGDSEANEAEDQFVRGKEGGSFKVRSDYCDQSWSELNLFYKPGLP
jgi:hypothetical protein